MTNPPGNSSFEQAYQAANSGQGGTTGPQVVPPGAASSAYQYESFVSGTQVQIGPAVAQMLGINPGTYSGAQLYQYMSDLPQARLSEFQSFLYNAGFYTDSQGQPLTGMAFGSLDNQSFNALANAVILAGDSGTTIDNAASNRIGSGAAALARTSLPQAQIGGGHTYEIDLSNPENVKYAADQIFQATDRRNATASEVEAITSALRSQQTGKGLAQEQAGEQQSRSQYQAQVNQRNTAYNFEYAPKIALGAIPSGPMQGPGQAAAALLGYMGLPVTQSNVQFLVGMSEASGGHGMNLWAVQNTPPGAKVAPNGQAQFSSWAQALQTTAASISSYQGIMGVLQGGNASQMTGDPTVKAELKKWGAGNGDISQQANSQSTQDEAQHGIIQNQNNLPNGGQANPTTFTSTQPVVPGFSGPNQQPTNQGGGASPADAQMADQASLNSEPAPSPADFRMADQASIAQANNPNTPAADVTPGQITANPGDTYINPMTVYTTDPASESAGAYNQATTGANRIEYGGNEYLNIAQKISQMIQSGNGLLTS